MAGRYDARYERLRCAGLPREGSTLPVRLAALSAGLQETTVTEDHKCPRDHDRQHPESDVRHLSHESLKLAVGQVELLP